MAEPSTSTPEELARAIDHIVAVLRDVGETQWRDFLRRNADLIRRGDFYGVERFLTAFGGMGSLNDLVIASSNNHPVLPSEESDINALLSGLLNRAYAIAHDLARFERQHGA
jgi:hypothetical protein